MRGTVSALLCAMHLFSFYRIFTGFHTDARKKPNGCFYNKIAAISSNVREWGRANLKGLKFQTSRIGDSLTRNSIVTYPTLLILTKYCKVGRVV
jgi:hypothetical protein